MNARWLATLGAVLQDDRGQTMAEYGLVAAVLGTAMIGAVAVMQQAAGGVLTASSAGWANLALTPP